MLLIFDITPVQTLRQKHEKFDISTNEWDLERLFTVRFYECFDTNDWKIDQKKFHQLTLHNVR